MHREMHQFLPCKQKNNNYIMKNFMHSIFASVKRCKVWIVTVFITYSVSCLTIITVAHDEDFAHRSDRIIEMSDGKIISHQ